MLQETPSEVKDFDAGADAFLDKVGTETPGASSDPNKPEGEESKTSEIPTAEVAKTDQVKEVEADSSLSPEDKINKIKEILGDDENALDAYIKQKGYHTDPAWQKQRELIERYKKEASGKSALSDEDREALAEVKRYRSSPEYVQASMKAQGYTQEAIDKKLKELGHEVQAKPQNDVDLVVNKLGVDLSKMLPDEKVRVLNNIEDVVRVADIIINDRLAKTLPKQLGPLQEHLGSIEKSENASRLTSTMRDVVKQEGILDFDKDITPALNKFLDENPDAVQQDVFEHFRHINHTLTVERLKTVKRKEERDDKRGNLRQNLSGLGNMKTPSRTGDFDKDADAILDALNV